jgi:hypothetical protein
MRRTFCRRMPDLENSEFNRGFCKPPLDDTKPGKQPQWLAAKFPVRPNREIKSP